MSCSDVVFSGQVNDSYTVLLREKKLPLALLEDPEAAARTGRKTARASLTAAQPFAATFGTKQTRKRPKLSAETYGDLIGSASQKETKCVVHLFIACHLCFYNSIAVALLACGAPGAFLMMRVRFCQTC